jgi:hypothetical protein
MSKSRAKRERQEARQRRQAAEQSLKKQEGGNGLGGMLRRKTLTHVLAGAAAVAGLWLVDKQMPFWTGSEKEYSIKMVFLEHDTADDANRFLKEVDKESSNGQPVQVLFLEAAGEKSEDYDNSVKTSNSNLADIRKEYADLINQGIGADAAKQKCISDQNSGDKGFSGTLLVGAALRNMKILPIEKYTDDEAGMQMQAFNKLVYERQLGQAGIGDRFSTVEEVVKVEQGDQDFYQKYGIDWNRTVKTANGLPDRFNDAVRLFPHLRLERLEGKQVKAMGFMGLNHGSMKFLFNSPKVEFSSETLTDPYSISRSVYAERVERSISNESPLTDRELRLIAIDILYVGRNMDKLIQYNPQIARQIVSNAMALTDSELQNMVRDSEQITDDNKRGVFIFNKLAGKDLF